MSEQDNSIRTGSWQPAQSEVPASDPAPVEMPAQIGRYRVVKLLGEGGFGQVFLAHDDRLNRPVAVKVPHQKLIARPEDADAYLTEAQNVASLDHPNIVPVHDVGSTDECPCFIVSKFIEGSTLAKRIKENRPSFAETAELMATVAEALHYAHCKGLVHRDIKPGNILLDATGKPFVTDFGLALREENIGHGPKYAGTPAYMSPEQARGEGHRVDGRSDIFSLGVVFYELLTGRRPFRGESKEELLEQITSFEPRPPRQLDDKIPKELERIALKALSKRATERYTTAKDMGDDLKQFLADQIISQPCVGAGKVIHFPVVQPSSVTGPSSPSGKSSPPATTPTSDSQPVKIVPKGLRSFDAHDADFFLELLPGAHDREGLPDSIRFWKTKIEETDADSTFSVGLIYGPSGCGKTSLVKAGLLPHLSGDVIAVYVEATANETEVRLLNGFRKRCPALPDNLGLKETLAALRRGQGIPIDKKVFIVLDQFEQWLHAKREERGTELVQALRHCDGGRVQCLVLVRDDFWMAATRFMRDLEIRLIEGQNSAAVDLFDLDHARKVLAAFGRAFGKLPESTPAKEHKDFLNQAVSGLAQEGKIVCIRLALFAEMLKGKPWTLASLKAVGGTEGVGVTFLEETFSAATAPPEHRYHQKAARVVLKALLPESGTDIKGHMRSDTELLAASGYANRRREFDDLLRILDSEIRLITPTDPEGKEATKDCTPHVQAGEKYYQLTHDYLVHSLRDWLTRKQKETRRGRAELRLAERAALWNSKPENRHLPSWWEWATIRLWTKKKDWTTPQRKMMRRASRYYAVCLFTLMLAGWGAFECFMYVFVRDLVGSLRATDTAHASAILGRLNVFQHWATPRLRQMYEESEPQSKERLNASLALLPVDPGQVTYLYGRMLEAGPTELPVIRHALLPYRDGLVEPLWKVLGGVQEGAERRFRAACVLATHDPGGEPKDERWQNVSRIVAGQLLAAVQKNPSDYAALLDQLRPVRARLLPPLTEAYRNKEHAESERSFAAAILADYAADQPPLLADLLMDADEKQFRVIYPKFTEKGKVGLPALNAEIETKLPDDLASSDERREKLAKRQANAAVALLRLGQPEKVWPLLKRNPPDDPRVRSYLIHRLSPLGADAGAIIKRLDMEPDITIRRALLLSLGEFSEGQLSTDARTSLLPKLKELYGNQADPGLHGAVEWLLRQWMQEDWLKQVNEAWAKNEKERAQWIETIQQLVKKDKAKAPPRWYVNSQGQTMVVIPGPVEFLMGSPVTEANREGGPQGKVEMQHTKRIGRSFAIAAKMATVEQFARFRKDQAFNKQYAPTLDCPVNMVSWYDAAAYCNWLSRQEGISEEQWCYLPAPGEKYEEGMKLAPDYLHRTGYRLPSEAEWESACRAGAITSRDYGESEELLGRYAWYTKNSLDRWMLPSGSLKPNDLGLFDMLGNALEWCQEAGYYYKAGEDIEDNKDIIGRTKRVLRGGSFDYHASYVRSAYRIWNVPSYGFDIVGFRPARTIAP
jgi:serine/threonine protein kinase/formylglycine-generating enzyme required for sulfatase activity